MALNYDTAVDAILSTLQVHWDAASLAVTGLMVPPVIVLEALEPDMRPHPKDGTLAWARAVVRHSDSRKASLTDSARTARYRRIGFVWVQVFTPAQGGAKSWTTCGQLAAVARDAYEGKRTGADGVVFTKASIFEQGKENQWYLANVRAEFYWDEIK